MVRELIDVVKDVEVLNVRVCLGVGCFICYVLGVSGLERLFIVV